MALFKLTSITSTQNSINDVTHQQTVFLSDSYVCALEKCSVTVMTDMIMTDIEKRGNPVR